MDDRQGEEGKKEREEPRMLLWADSAGATKNLVGVGVGGVHLVTRAGQVEEATM